MGRVLLVHDSFLGRDVALKELLPGPVSRDPAKPSTPARRYMGYLSRFLQEARITGQLEHPSIVPVYELGHRRDGSLYYTMKLVRGKTLREAIRERKTQQERLELLPHFVNLCQAIAYAHSRGIIHRDLKPDNVMVGEFGETVVLDWGLAKAKDRDDVHADGLAETIRLLNLGHVDSAAKTPYGQVLGTPAYMPPEQAKGQLDLVDERSDVYSLGALLYEILSGQIPFRGANVMDVLRKVLHKSPEPLTDEVAPPELCAICAMAMQKDPAQRYASAAKLAEDVQRFQAGALVQSYTYGFKEHLFRFVRRHRAIALTAAVASLLVLMMGIVSYVNISRERDIAVGARVQAETSEAAAKRASYRSSILLASAQNNEHQIVPANETLWQTPPESRGWEWGHLLHECNKDLASFLEHKGAVWSVGINRDGTRVVTGDYQGVCYVWKVDTGETLARIEASPIRRPISSAAFSPDDSGILLATTDGLPPRIFDAQTGALQSTVGESVSGYANILAYSRSGAFIALDARDRAEIHVRDAKSHAVVARLPDQPGVTALDFAPDDGVLVSGTSGGDVFAWDWRAGRQLAVLDTHDSECTVLKYYPDGSAIAGACRDNTVRVWDSRSFALLHTLELPSMPLGCDVNRNMLVAGCVDGSVHIFEIPSLKPIRRFIAHGEAINAIGIAGDSKYLVTASDDQTAKVWPLAGGARVPVLKSSGLWITASADGRYVAIVQPNTTVAIYSGSGAPLARLAGMDAYRCVWSPNGQRLLVIPYGSAPILITTDDWSITALLTGHRQSVYDAAFSADGRRLATLSAPYVVLRPSYYLASAPSESIPVRLWDGLSGDPLGPLEGEIGPCTGASFTSSGNLLVCGTDGIIREWDLSSNRLVRSFDTGLEDLRCINGSRDGLIAVGTEDGTVGTIDLSRPNSAQTARGHEGPVTSVRLSPDKSRVASTGEDGSVLIWDSAYHMPLLRFSMAQQVMLAAEWDKDGRRLSSVTRNGLYQWEADPWQEAALPNVSGGSWSERYAAYKRVGRSRDDTQNSESMYTGRIYTTKPRLLRKLSYLAQLIATGQLDKRPSGFAVDSANQLGFLRMFGLEEGDVIHSVNGQPLENDGVLRIEIDRLRSADESSTAVIDVDLVRNEGIVTYSIQTVAPRSFSHSISFPAALAVPILKSGLMAVEKGREYLIGVTRDCSEFMGEPAGDDEINGWWLAQFSTGSNEQEKNLIRMLDSLNKTVGLQVYDHIVALNGRPLNSVDVMLDMLREAVDHAEKGAPFTLLLDVERGTFQHGTITVVIG